MKEWINLLLSSSLLPLMIIGIDVNSLTHSRSAHVKLDRVMAEYLCIVIILGSQRIQCKNKKPTSLQSRQFDGRNNYVYQNNTCVIENKSIVF